MNLYIEYDTNNGQMETAVIIELKLIVTINEFGSVTLVVLINIVIIAIVDCSSLHLLRIFANLNIHYNRSRSTAPLKYF